MLNGMLLQIVRKFCVSYINPVNPNCDLRTVKNYCRTLYYSLCSKYLKLLSPCGVFKDAVIRWC
jgi:hypothetical protein